MKTGGQHRDVNAAEQSAVKRETERQSVPRHSAHARDRVSSGIAVTPNEREDYNRYHRDSNCKPQCYGRNAEQ